MEIRLVIFLAFASVTVITNTMLIVFAYKAFANVTSRVTATVSEFEKSSETRAWIDSLQIAAEQAVLVTEATKQTMAEFTPVISRAHENYIRTLVNVDSKLETVADEVSTGARKVRDAVAKPAFSVMAFAASLTKVLETMRNDE
jgi:hypothetical protein